jgi:hypothetical protein
MSRVYRQKLVGTFGAVQIGTCEQAVLIDTTSRTYDTAGYLHVDRSCLRLPLREAYRLQRLLSQAMLAAKASKPHQPGLWSNATTFRKVRP